MRTETVVRAEQDLRRERRLLVSGPPGIGKTALLDALAERAAARGERVLYLCPQPPDHAVPFATVADLLLALPDRRVDLLPCHSAKPPPQSCATTRRHPAVNRTPWRYASP